MRLIALLESVLILGFVHIAHGQTLEINLPANSIAYSAQTAMLYATIASSAGVGYGNTLVEIAPTTGTITRSVFVGSEPTALAISPDVSIAYVGLDGAAAVRQVDLSAMTAGIQFELGPSTGFGPLFPTQIVVMPGSPNTIAVSRHDIGVTPDYQGVGIFDSGVMRPTAITSFFGPISLAFDAANTLFGYDNENQANVYQMAIDANGVTVTNSVPGLITGYGVNILVDGGLIYATSGTVVNESNLQLVGTYQSSGPVVVDDTVSSVMFVNQTSVRVFDRDSFDPMYSAQIPKANGNPISAAGCGSRCIAAVFDSGQIIIMPDVDHIFGDGFE